MNDIIVTQDIAYECLQNINNCGQVSMDTETNITEKMSDRYMLGFSVYSRLHDTGYYFPVKHPNFKNLNLCGMQINPSSIVWHNGKFDRQVFKQSLDVNLDNIPFEDTMLLSYVLNEEPPHGLKELADKYLDKTSSQDRNVLKILGKAFAWEDIPVEFMGMYAIQDVRLTDSLYMKLLNLLNYSDSSQKNIYENDKILCLILQGIEERGIKIDSAEARLKAAKCAELMSTIQTELGYDPAKPAELAKRLYSFPPEGLGLTPIELGHPTKSFPNGRPSMKSANLVEHRHPETAKVLEYRKIVKVKSSYYEAWPELVDKNNRLHPTYNQHSTVTSRLSCSKPNMQQIPRESAENLVKTQFPVKQLVRAKEGYSVWELDYDQQELRLASVYAQEEAMLQVFTSGGDPHQLMADTLNVTRFLGKVINFLLPYGGGAARLQATVNEQAPTLKFTLSDAQKIHSNYHDTYPGFRDVAMQCQLAMESRGYIMYWSGRKRRMKFDQHKAFNSLIQGGCAEITRETMRRINARMFSTQMISQVHDSLWFETNTPEELDEIKTIMEWPTQEFGLPFTVEIKKIA